MKIIRVDVFAEHVPLTRPYAISTVTTSEVDLLFVRLVTDGPHVGVGAGSPGESITGETAAACERALRDEIVPRLEGRDPRRSGALRESLRDGLDGTPAAQAAADMALFDLLGKMLEVPVVDLLGRRRDPLPTSVTIGIKSTEDAIAEADEYRGRGFRILKVKLGRSLDDDLDRLRRLREHVGSSMKIRVDANEGYDLDETRRFFAAGDDLNLELVEQPLPASAIAGARELPPDLRRRLALDESVHREPEALAMLQEPRPGDIHVLKLMKCGGLTAARTLSRMAEAAGVDLMWGCMDESRVSIAAALHAAYASPATRYLDLDGHLDLQRDPASGGFSLDDGVLRLGDRPGLGVDLQL